MKLTPQMRARLAAAQRDLEARAARTIAGWTDDQTISALKLILAGLSARDAAAVVMGDAVLEDGVVDYNPGCAWIDTVLDRRQPTIAECEQILSQWEMRRDTIAAETVVAHHRPARSAPALHLVF